MYWDEGEEAKQVENPKEKKVQKWKIIAEIAALNINAT